MIVIVCTNDLLQVVLKNLVMKSLMFMAALNRFKVLESTTNPHWNWPAVATKDAQPWPKPTRSPSSKPLSAIATSSINPAAAALAGLAVIADSVTESALVRMSPTPALASSVGQLHHIPGLPLPITPMETRNLRILNPRTQKQEDFTTHNRDRRKFRMIGGGLEATGTITNSTRVFHRLGMPRWMTNLLPNPLTMIPKEWKWRVMGMTRRRKRRFASRGRGS